VVVHLEGIKMISAVHSSNNGKNKVTKKTLIVRQYFEYSSEELINTEALELTPREKIKFEVIHNLIKTHISRQFKT